MEKHEESNDNSPKSAKPCDPKTPIRASWYDAGVLCAMQGKRHPTDLESEHDRDRPRSKHIDFFSCGADPLTTREL